MIERDELPIGFTMELAMNPEAMSRFSGLTEPEQKQVVNRARNIMSHEEMRGKYVYGRMMAHGQNTDTRKAGSRQTGTPGTSRKKQQHLWGWRHS